jgi:hypothetical protein
MAEAHDSEVPEILASIRALVEESRRLAKRHEEIMAEHRALMERLTEIQKEKT